MAVSKVFYGVHLLSADILTTCFRHLQHNAPGPTTAINILKLLEVGPSLDSPLYLRLLILAKLTLTCSNRDPVPP
jgi:hypothetical protein